MDILVLFVLLQLKHWYVDFVNQTPEEVQAKGVYGDPLGICHSLKHALFTFVIFSPVDLLLAVILFCLDFFEHYHIDWFKMNYGCRDVQDPKFWRDLGLDQMAHQICYAFYVYFYLIGV